MSAFLGRAPGPLNFTPAFLTTSKITCIAAELRGCVLVNFFLSQMHSFGPAPSPTCPYLSLCPRVVNSDSDDLLLRALCVLGMD